MKKRTQKKFLSRSIRDLLASRKARRDWVKYICYGSRPANGFLVHSIRVVNMELIASGHVDGIVFDPLNDFSEIEAPLTDPNNSIRIVVENTLRTYETLSVIVSGIGVKYVLAERRLEEHMLGYNHSFKPGEKTVIILSPSIYFKMKKLFLEIGPNYYAVPRRPKKAEE